MAKTISNLLVGIGFDLDKKSTDKVSSGIDGIKSKALKLGSIVAGAFGIKELTTDFANAKDDLGKFAQIMGVSADDVNAFGAAIRLERGTLKGFMSQLAGLEKFRAGFLVGDIGFLPAAEKAGVDTKTIIDAKNAAEAYLSLADQFQRMSREQRINAAAAMGLDEASIRLLSKGRAAVEAIIKQQKLIRPVDIGMTEMAAEFNNSTQILLDNMGAVADKFSKILLPGIIEELKELNSWFDKFRKVSTGEFVAEAAKKIIEKVMPRPGAGGLVPKVKFERVKRKELTPAEKAAEQLEERAAIAESLEAARKDPNTSASYLKLLEKISNGSKQSQVPIVIKNDIHLDGKLIDSKVNKIVGEMADQAIQDLKSTEGG